MPAPRGAEGGVQSGALALGNGVGHGLRLTPGADMPTPAEEQSNQRRGRRLVRRMYWPRITGMGLGTLMVAGALHQIGVPLWAWLALAINGVVWPHLAYLHGVRNVAPFRAEHRNLLVDSVCGGFWLVGIGFNLLPSTLMLTMLTMNNVSIGGARLVIKGVMAMLAGALVAWPLFGIHLTLASNLYLIVSSIPFMVTYPIFVGVVSYRLAQELSRQKRKFELLSQRDPLSGLASRGYWEVRLNQEYCRWRRHARPVSLLLADIDHFKRINDLHGHLFGDMVIRSISELLSSQAREEDIVGRYGGEEFALILPETTVAGAVALAKRIQQSMQAVAVTGGPELNLTISIGVAAVSEDVVDTLDWINRADRALYRAKRDGRNRICIFGEDARDHRMS